MFGIDPHELAVATGRDRPVGAHQKIRSPSIFFSCIFSFAGRRMRCARSSSYATIASVDVYLLGVSGESAPR